MLYSLSPGSLPLPPHTSAGLPPMCVSVMVNETQRYLATSILMWAEASEIEKIITGGISHKNINVLTKLASRTSKLSWIS
jgi:hypothetical protein